jgi:hypothetical protein
MLFYKGMPIFGIYVDGGIFCGPKLKAIEGPMQDLTKAGYNLELMGDVKDYLGISFSSCLMAGLRCPNQTLLIRS